MQVVRWFLHAVLLGELNDNGKLPGTRLALLQPTRCWFGIHDTPMFFFRRDILGAQVECRLVLVQQNRTSWTLARWARFVCIPLSIILLHCRSVRGLREQLARCVRGPRPGPCALYPLARTASSWARARRSRP